MSLINKILEDIEKKKHYKDPFEEKYLNCVLKEFDIDSVYEASQNVHLRKEIIAQMQKKLQKDVDKYSSITKESSTKELNQKVEEEEEIEIDHSKFEEYQKIIKEKVLPDLKVDIKRSNININALIYDDFNQEYLNITNFKEQSTKLKFQRMKNQILT